MSNFKKIKSYSIPALFFLISILIFGHTYFDFSNKQKDLIPVANNIHSQHTEVLRANGQQGKVLKKINVDFNHAPIIQPNQNTKLSFKIIDLNGKDVVAYDNIYDKNMHLIVVDDSLNYYNHIHPEKKGATFSIDTQFPKSGIYYLYLDFQPSGSIEQQKTFKVEVGNNPSPNPTSQTPDTDLTKVFGEYKVDLKIPKPLLASSMNLGYSNFLFTIYDSKTDKPITNLKPYLGAYGHMVMVRQDTYDYIHVHPVGKPEYPGASGGPTVNFVPLALAGPIKPGIYRVFTQFNPNGQLITTDFTVKIEQ